MTLHLYNTLTRNKEPFQPKEPGKVKMYCCGVTVYDYCHLGHARSYIVWDVVRRYLTWQGYEVTYVQNFTDIDDKILNRARREGSSMTAIADRYTETYFEDMARLNVAEADCYPRATQTMPGIQRAIAELEGKGFAYAMEGDVYFAVGAFPDYGKLSGRNLEDLQAGASGRVSHDDSKKKEAFDFALWKGVKPEEPFWDSPWGQGRPGWHIECSAMVREHLGDTIDIHTGGGDLIFPHHENEIAQSEAITGQPLARYWLHNGMVNVGGEKMSKSLGNFTTIRQLLDAPDGPEPMALRLFILQAQYRKPIDFTGDAIASARNGWQTLKEGLTFGDRFLNSEASSPEEGILSSDGSLRDPLQEARDRFQAAMDDDFNTPETLAVLFELAKDLRREGNVLVHGGQPSQARADLQQQWQLLVALSGVLGLAASPEDSAAQTAASTSDLSDSAIEAAIAQRQAARQAKKFAEADRLRDELKAQGVILVDRPGGATVWHRE